MRINLSLITDADRKNLQKKREIEDMTQKQEIL